MLVGAGDAENMARTPEGKEQAVDTVSDCVAALLDSAFTMPQVVQGASPRGEVRAWHAGTTAGGNSSQMLCTVTPSCTAAFCMVTGQWRAI